MLFSSARRRVLGLGARAAVAGAAAPFFVRDGRAEPATGAWAGLAAPLDAFVETYLREMNAPGLVLALADREGVRRVAGYGLGDLERRAALDASTLVHIGSITKSFVALCLLQLRDEGRLDLERPVRDYLPWLRIESAFAPITTHHLLTHSAGLPGIPPVFLSDPASAHRAAHAPGAHFHYCNTGYTILGHLLSAIDGRTLPEAIRARILVPLGMTQSEPVITLAARGRMVKSYAAFQNDRPYPRSGRLAEAPAIVSTDAAGCIAATAGDMGRYAQLLANRGRGPRGRLVSEEAFALFSRPHVKAAEFGETAAYGYGIAVDTLDGHTILRHTGGMVSFASALQVDLDEGTGVFASVNAMQGYRPNPVAQHALALARARRGGRPLPPAPAIPSPARVENAAGYAGSYRAADGRVLELAAEGASLFVWHEGRKVPLENATGPADAFVARHPDLACFLFVFGRADAKDPGSAVVELGWGGDWYANARYTGPTRFETPKEWDAYLGHYRNENPWVGSLRVVRRKGRLLLDGVVPLEPGEGGLFHLRDEEHSPEWIRFADVVDGRAMRVKLSGEDLWRVQVD